MTVAPLQQSGLAQTAGRIRALAYVTAEKAPLYRAIMRAFIVSRERFAPHLHVTQVSQLIETSGFAPTPDLPELEAALAQLCEWGNLQTLPDTSDVNTVEDFYKQRYVFQMTNLGEAAERSLDLFQTASASEGELQVHALREIHSLLKQLRQLLFQPETESTELHKSLVSLRERFEEFKEQAQTFMAGLQQKIDLKAVHTHQFTPDTRRLIEYIERFVGELVLSGDSITETILAIEETGMDRLLHAAARLHTRDALATPNRLQHSFQEWCDFWDGFRGWFISEPSVPSNAETLRARARSAIPALLSMIANVTDRRMNRIDRSNDWRVLSRWFAEAESDVEAHRLWRAVFGLSPARHLTVNDATLDEHELQDVSPDTSWLDTPPLRISLRLREYGSHSRTGRLSRIIDRTSEKKKLAAATEEEALRILEAQSRFGAAGRMRLSDLEYLATGEFDLFLDLLGGAMSASLLSGDAVEIPSSSGSLTVRLEPTGDGRTASIQTPEGVFSGPDHWISIERSFTEVPS
jgi:uncharacterized protein (TIGR02677 family)